MSKPKFGLMALFPGREVPIQDDEGNEIAIATVYPLGARHIERFSSDVASVGLVLLEALKVKVSDDGNVSLDQKSMQPDRIIAAATPALIRNGFGLLRDCIKIAVPGSSDDDQAEDVTLEDLPHWCLPDVVEAFIEESFGSEKKWRPWRRLIEGLTRRFTGDSGFSISETWSKLSSQLGTASKTSSTNGSQDGPTEGGATGSSATGPSAPDVASTI